MPTADIRRAAPVVNFAQLPEERSRALGILRVRRNRHQPTDAEIFPAWRLTQNLPQLRCTRRDAAFGLLAAHVDR